MRALRRLIVIVALGGALALAQHDVCAQTQPSAPAAASEATIPTEGTAAPDQQLQPLELGDGWQSQSPNLETRDNLGAYVGGGVLGSVLVVVLVLFVI